MSSPRTDRPSHTLVRIPFRRSDSGHNGWRRETKSRFTASLITPALLAGLLGLFGLPGCVDATATLDPLFADLEPHEGQVLVFHTRPGRDWVRIGSVYADGAVTSDESAMMKALRESAAKIGGQAVLVRRSDPMTDGWPGVDGGSFTRRKASRSVEGEVYARVSSIPRDVPMAP